MANNWAIVIGINHYEHLPSERHLRFAVRDAERIREFLYDRAGFPSENILLCTDESQPAGYISTRPAYTHLKRLLREYVPKQATEADNLWFFFAGHGIVGDDHQDYLLPSDGDPNSLKDTAISTTFVTEHLRNCHAKNVVLILDMCRREGSNSSRDIGTEIGEKTIEVTKQDGLITIFSCNRGQYSYEIPMLQQGAFTYTLLKGLRQNTILRRLETYLNREVPELNRVHGFSSQIPRIVAEPAGKYNLPLLPDYMTQSDIADLMQLAAQTKEEADSALLLYRQREILSLVINSPSSSLEERSSAQKEIERIDQKIKKGTAIERSAIERLANLVSETVLNEGNIGADSSTLSAIYNASEEYVTRYQRHYGILRILDMERSTSLEEIYITVQLRDKEGIGGGQHHPKETLEDDFFRAGRSRLQYPRQSGMDVVNDQQYVMILGGPGAGKSTFLRQIGWEALKGSQDSYRHAQIPVLIELKTFRDSNHISVNHLRNAVVQELEKCNYPNPETLAIKSLKTGKLLLLFDGLDEVETDLWDHMLNTIEEFVDEYRKNRFICSCRIAAYKSRLRQFIDVEIADFDDSQIQQFVKNWFSSSKDMEFGMANRFLTQLEQGDYQKARELAHTPLLLIFLCITFDAYQTLSKRRADLYNQALDILLRRWATDRRIQANPIYKDLSLKLENLMLEEIAYNSFLKSRLFNYQDIINQIDEFIKKNRNAPKHLDSEKVLEAIEIEQGILVRLDRNSLSFSHLTLQEYLTAQYIAGHDQLRPLMDHLIDRRWREVFLLVAELVRNADQLLKLMEEEVWMTLDLSSHSRLNQAIDWSVQVTRDSTGDYHPVSKRVIMVAYAYAFAYAHNRSRANLGDAINRARPQQYDRKFEYFFQCAKSCACVFDSKHSDDIKASVDNISAYAVDLAQGIARSTNIDRAIALADTLDKLKLLKNVSFQQFIADLHAMKSETHGNYDPETHRHVADSIWQRWIETLGLKQEWLFLDEKEEQALNSYFYACELMRRCSDTAVDISDVYEKIEARMLTTQKPPRNNRLNLLR